MKKALKLFGIIAFVMLIGFSMAACGGGDSGSIIIPPNLINGDGNDADPINGTYKASDGEIITLNNGSFEGSRNGAPYMKGIYTASARSISAKIDMAVNELNGNYLNEMDEGPTFKNQWYNKNQVINAFKIWMKETYPQVSDQDISDIIDDMADDFNDMFPTTTATIEDDTMTWDGVTYTKETTSSGGGGGGGGGSGGTFTLTDIPATYNGKYAMCSGVMSSNPGYVLIGCDRPDATFTLISNGKVILPMWYVASTTMQRYSGNDTDVSVTVSIYNSQPWSSKDNNILYVLQYQFNVNFSNGSASRSWNAADVSAAPQ